MILVQSKAGHDKDRIFFIIEEAGEYVYLVDGKTRTLRNPKKKNRKHIEVLPFTWEPETRDKLRDEEIKYALKQFKCSNK